MAQTISVHNIDAAVPDSNPLQYVPVTINTERINFVTTNGETGLAEINYEGGIIRCTESYDDVLALWSA